MARERKVTAIQLKVMEAKQRDVGKGRARLDLENMNFLKVTAGDIVELIGKQSTAAMAWPADPDDQNLGIVRLDGQTRKNAGVALNEYVAVKRCSAKTAASITLVPVGAKLKVDKDFAEFVKNRLKGFPVAEGNDISVVVLGNPIVFNVAKVRPRAVIKVTGETSIKILPEPLAEREISSAITYDAVGGLKKETSRLREIVELPLRHPEVFKRLGVEAPKGILLYGPPGCGKTLLAKALANECEASFYSISGPEIMNKFYGESEARLREIFKEARENAPAIIFLDEIDAIAPKREDVFGDVEKRVVAQLLALMDGLSERGDVVVIGATNRPEGIDSALRRPGRFDREIEIGVPNVEDRLEILQIHTRGMPLNREVDLKQLSVELHGYTGADLKALSREAALKALRRYLPDIDLEGGQVAPEVLERLVVTEGDFREAVKEIVPTAMREFYIEMPSVKWSDVGGLEDVKRTLQENIIRAIRSPERFTQAGVKPPRGVLLYGPSGCGKTLLAKAVACESSANIITVRGPEILSRWLGESEKAVRDIFRKAKASAPCIILFDEIDSIAKARGYGVEDSDIGDRVLSQLLTEIDGASGVNGVLVVGVTNRPDLLDPSLLRPGRLDLLLYISPPDEEGREEIFKVISKSMPLGEDVSLLEIAASTKGYSGADLEALCREAAISALDRGDERLTVVQADFQEALKRVKPSITPEVTSWYEALRDKIANRLPKQAEKWFYG